MYSPHHLDSPPPVSQFRRPWSPVEFETYDESAQRQARQASEYSFEALDLTEYQTRLPQIHIAEDIRDQSYSIPRPLRNYSEYRATPPRRFSLASRCSFLMSSPSLTSGASSSSHAYSARLSTPPPLHRPFSLPASRITNSHVGSDSSRAHNYPWLAEDEHDEESVEDDFSSFPEWSRDWFRNKAPNPSKRVYEPILSFDPAAIASHCDNTYPSSTVPYSSSNESHRNLLPWSAEDRGLGTEVTPEMKKERMRMLKQEFGNISTNPLDYQGRKVVGTVNEEGVMITSGPKKRKLTRWAQGIFSSGAMLASLYSAVILKPSGKPPPKGTVAAYLLYILSVFTVLMMVYMFLVRPCCFPGKRKSGHNYEGLGGMMVLPVQGLPGTNEKKKGKRNRKKGEKDTPTGLNVNLIVDPTAFGNFAESADPGADGIRAINRRGIFEGLALEQKWKFARKDLKRFLMFDIILFFAWGLVFIIILLGKRCPIGKFEGWCDGYNVATAISSFLVLLFALSVFFDIKDLHASKVSPRTRT